jgi:hypothetical protein
LAVGVLGLLALGGTYTILSLFWGTIPIEGRYELWLFDEHADREKTWQLVLAREGLAEEILVWSVRRVGRYEDGLVIDAAGGSFKVPLHGSEAILLTPNERRSFRERGVRVDSVGSLKARSILGRHGWLLGAELFVGVCAIFACTFGPRIARRRCARPQRVSNG